MRVSRFANFGYGNEEQVMEYDDDVVELSIAASEAVLIHEIVSGLGSDRSLVSKVLEAVSKLKEARLSVSKEVECSENASIIDYLSDLEDSSMEEAYNDVGLSIADLRTIHVPEILQEVDNHIEASLTHSSVPTSEDAGKYDKLLGGCPAKFNKRWYGNWTWKEEMKYSAPVDHQYARVIPELFVDVTSFLSESADTAALDENSVVQGQAKGTFTASQLSTGAQVIGEKTNDQTQVSEDILTRSSLQSNDPLCSVVPCSISCHDLSSSPFMDNDGIPSGWKSTSSTKYPTESIPTVATSHDKLACTEQFTHVTLPALYRRLTTLRPYSVLLHGQSYCGSPLNKASLESLPKLTAQGTINNVSETCPVNTFEKICELGEDVVRSDSNVQKKSMVQKSAVELLPAKESRQVQTIFKEQNCNRVPGRKRVRFMDPEDNSDPKQEAKKQHAMQETCYSRRTKNYPRYGSQLNASRASSLKRRPYNSGDKHRKRMIFQNIEFLLTGFSTRKEKKLEVLIRKYRGIILSDIPSSLNTRFRRCSRYNNISQVVISPKKI